MTLTDFLLARIAEDEAVARYAASLDAYFIGYDTGDRGEAWRGDAGPYHPARVLAECEAKRRIVEILLAFDPFEHDDLGLLRALALPYADYRQEWKS